MDAHGQAGAIEPPYAGRKREPRWFTIADLVLIVAGVAFLMVSSSRMASGLIPLSLPFLVILSLSQLMFGVAEVLALVVLGRRARYGGPIRSAEWLVLGLASLALAYQVPNLDTAVNAFYRAAGSDELGFGCPLAAQRARGPGRRPGRGRTGAFRAPAARKVACSRALSVAGITVGLCLWFWGPCAVAHLELPWLLIPSPAGEPSTWGWRGPLVFALRNIVANGLSVFTWGVLISAAVLAWRADRRAGSSRVWSGPSSPPFRPPRSWPCFSPRPPSSTLTGPNPSKPRSGWPGSPPSDWHHGGSQLV